MATQFSTIIGRYAVKAGRSTVPRARPNLSSTFPAAIATHFLMNSARLVPSRNFASDDGSHSDFAPQRKQVKNDIDEAVEMIKEHVKEHPVMLYMKGSPNMPMCGFSSRVVQVLKGTGVDFSSVNVLDYPSIREGVKKFSEWPTIPQLYVNGEFIGGSCSCNWFVWQFRSFGFLTFFSHFREGCDIVEEMHGSGELEELLKPYVVKDEEK